MLQLCEQLPVIAESGGDTARRPQALVVSMGVSRIAAIAQHGNRLVPCFVIGQDALETRIEMIMLLGQTALPARPVNAGVGIVTDAVIAFARAQGTDTVFAPCCQQTDEERSGQM